MKTWSNWVNKFLIVGLNFIEVKKEGQFVSVTKLILSPMLTMGSPEEFIVGLFIISFSDWPYVSQTTIFLPD